MEEDFIKIENDNGRFVAIPHTSVREAGIPEPWVAACGRAGDNPNFERVSMPVSGSRSYDSVL